MPDQREVAGAELLGAVEPPGDRRLARWRCRVQHGGEQGPPGDVSGSLPLVCRLAGIRAGSAMCLRVLPGQDLICCHQRFPY